MLNDIKETLASLRHRPVILYGTGDGADKIIELLDDFGISVSGIFASDGFVRKRTFHGFPVKNYSDIKKEFGNPVILLCFGTSIPEVINNVILLSGENTLIVPDIPVCGDTVFDADFYMKHKDEIAYARELFSDEESKIIYDCIISSKLNWSLNDILKADEISGKSEIHLLGDYSAYVDFGAYRGDTLEQTLSLYPNIKKVAAFEPSEKNFSKLQQISSSYTNVLFDLTHGAASDKDGTVYFADGGGRGSSLEVLNAPSSLSGAKCRECPEVRADSVIHYKNERLLLKYDVEGWEDKALNGSLDMISDNDTDIIMSVYHRSEDIFSLPIRLSRLLPKHKLSLRKKHCLPCWEISLYVYNR